MTGATISVSNGQYIVPGIQLRRRRFVPKWLGDLVLWLFFHRLDSSTRIEITGLREQDAVETMHAVGGKPPYPPLN